MRRGKRWFALAGILVLATTSRAVAAPACPRGLTADVPARETGAANGSAFASRIMNLTRLARDRATLAELERGNLPPFLRELVAVPIKAYSSDGRPLAGILCVMPDYLAVGSDRDFLRMPLGLPAATRIARRFGFVLPTTRMVDAIHRHTPRQLRPQPLPTSRRMRSTAYIVQHERAIATQLRGLGLPAGELLSGHKKDLVASARLDFMRGRVALYGWHELNGEPIQPLSTRHGEHYVDYSHGVRLVSELMQVNGRVMDVHDVVENTRLAPLVSREGPLPGMARYLPRGQRRASAWQARMDIR